MDHEAHEAAVLAVTAAEAAAHVARAVAVFDALDAHAGHLTRHDRYDFAWSTWQTFTEIEAPDQPVDAIATVLLRAGRRMTTEPDDTDVVTDHPTPPHPPVSARGIAREDTLTWA